MSCSKGTPMSNLLEKLKNAWHDVWTRAVATVLAAGILGGISTISPNVRGFLAAASLVPNWALVLLGAALLLCAMVMAVARRPKTQITFVGTEVKEDKRPDISFPLKVYCEMRNDSNRVVDVRLFTYISNAVKVKRFTPGALQLKFGQGQTAVWAPQPDAVERVAAYPRETFRAWVAPDEFNKVTLEGLRGRIGTLVLDVDGQKIDMPL
jgi:hypothetical protein